MRVTAPILTAPDDRLGEYNNWDTFATARLAAKTPSLLESHGQLDFFQREIEPCYPAVVAMQMRGVPIDTQVRLNLRREFRAEVRECDRLLCAAKGQPYIDFWDPGYKKYKGFKPNSDPQIRRWLFEELELRPAGKTDTGLHSVDQDNLSRILRDLRVKDEPHREILYALLHRSRFLKLDEYLDFETLEGRAYPTVKMHGTESFRFAYSNPPLHSWAKEIRTMVAAPHGKLLISADFSQIEARMAAYLSGDKPSIAIYERTGNPPYKYHPDWDVHARTVLDAFHISESTWALMPTSEKVLHREVAKTIYFGTFLYGGAPETAKTRTTCPCPKCADKKPPTLDVTPKRKRIIHDVWLSKHREFARWRSQLLTNFSGAHATHCLTSHFGWKRWFCTPWSEELKRQLYNWPIQHAANLMKLRALRRMHAKEVPIIFDHHDALVAEVPQSEVDRVKRIMVDCMTEPVPELGGIRFPVEVSVGRSWGGLG